MPYIKANDGRREALRNNDYAQTAGELNYQIFWYVKHHETIDWDVVKDYVVNFLADKVSYQRYNDMVGCLILCGLEIERRLGRKDIEELLNIINSYREEIFVYENEKVASNGDVE